MNIYQNTKHLQIIPRIDKSNKETCKKAIFIINIAEMHILILQN